MEAFALDQVWLASAAKLCGGRELDGGESALRVQYVSEADAGEVQHFQVFESGRLIEWGGGSLVAPDLWLKQPGWAQLAMFERTGLGAEVLSVTKAVDPASGAELPIPPMDEVELPWHEQLPAFSTLGPFTVQQTLLDSPFGDVEMFVRLDRGRVVETGLGEVDEAEVVIGRRYGSALRERLGTVDVLASLERGWLDGDFRYVSAFLGLYETDECVEGRRALTTSCCEPLAVLGDILSSPAWAEVAGGLAALDDGVVSVP